MVFGVDILVQHRRRRRHHHHHHPSLARWMVLVLDRTLYTGATILLPLLLLQLLQLPLLLPVVSSLHTGAIGVVGYVVPPTASFSRLIQYHSCWTNHHHLNHHHHHHHQSYSSSSSSSLSLFRNGISKAWNGNNYDDSLRIRQRQNRRRFRSYYYGRQSSPNNHKNNHNHKFHFLDSRYYKTHSTPACEGAILVFHAKNNDDGDEDEENNSNINVEDYSSFNNLEEEDNNIPSITTTTITTTSSSSSLENRNKNTIVQTEGGVIMPEGGANPCVIKVLGVGGGGGNAVNRMIQTRIDGVSFWAVNTDAQALAKSLAPNVLNIGRTVTRGLGAGGVPTVGKASAQENAKEIQSIVKGSDMIFITAGMGGGTGSGAGPIVAEIARDAGCLTVGVVTKPFAFEGRRRMQQAEAAIAELRKHVDTLIVVSNDKLLRIVPENTPVTDAFLVADDILRQGVVGISEIIIKTGLVNVDFADVRAVMKDAGTALMGVGTGVGKTRATDAAVAAISSPLLDFPISEAKRIVFNVVGGSDLGLSEINAASEVIYENAHEDANIIFGALIDPDMGDEVSITVLACDFRETKLGSDAEPSFVSASPTSLSSSSSSSSTGSMTRNGEGEYRSPNFYKQRREMTRSPLGPDATVEETRTAITRGFKRPDPPTPSSSREEDRGSFAKRKGGFFRRLFGGG